MRVVDYIIEKLVKEKITTSFGVTGRGSLFLTDAIAKNKNMNCTFVHHEQSAAFAAIAASSTTNDVSCCFVSTGCASTNTITGVLSAWQDCLPCIFISGQNNLVETQHYTKLKIRTFGQQEADIISLIKPITKYSVMLSDPNMVKYEVEKALYLSCEGRKGPVWIDIPIDVQNMRIKPETLKKFTPKKVSITYKTSDINYVVSKLNNAKRPAILIGSGVKASKAKREFLQFVKKFNLPVTFTTSSTDTYGTKNKLSIGSVGSQGCSRAGAFVVQNCDLLIVLGSRINSLTTGPDFHKFARGAKIVVVDIDHIEHTKKSIRIDKLIISNIKFFLEKINTKKINSDWDLWVKKCLHWKKIFKTFEKKIDNYAPIDLYHLSNVFSEIMPKESIFICDSGFADVIMPSNIKFNNKQTCLHPASQGAMGYALPATIGAAKVSQKNIISVIGDGSIMMNLQELETISHHKLPAKIFVINNNVYAIIRRRQKDLFRKRLIGTDPNNGVSCPNFKKVANCFNLQYEVIKNNKNLKKKLINVLNKDGPVLCEIYGLENQDYIEIGYAKTESKKIVRRPLEDQYPFLDRKLFLKEMLIKPIDQ